MEDDAATIVPEPDKAVVTKGTGAASIDKHGVKKREHKDGTKRHKPRVESVDKGGKLKAHLVGFRRQLQHPYDDP